VTNPMTIYIKDQCRILSATTVTDVTGTEMNLPRGVRACNDLIESAKSASRKVIVAGNGGSAAIALHMVEDLVKLRSVRAMSLLSGPMLTCIGNDLGFERVFSVPINLLADCSDVVVLISSSGSSPNILRAAEAAAERSCRLVTFTGMDAGNRLRKMGDVNFYVPSWRYGQVESAHATLMHCVLDCV